MTTFATHPLYLALTAVGVLVASSAHAVNVSADGRGQVLLYPYYTTRADSAGNPYGTLVSVINATASAKAVRVRFLEGKNSREVLDFNLFLSPFDVWTGAVLPDPGTGGARVGTIDLSCTLPPFSASGTSPFVSFANSAYAFGSDDGGGTSLDRTKEGYFEIIEMASYSPGSITGKAIIHAGGVPPCNSGGNVLNDTQAALDAQPPNGGLFGGMTLINVNSGTDYTADATALANFYQGASNYHAAGFLQPDLTQATPPVSSIQAPNGALYESTWTAGSADAVSAVLMHDRVMNEYVLDSATKSGTDWVLTMPTKRYYVANGPGNSGRLFQSNFSAGAGSCDGVSLDFWDREERQHVIDIGFPIPIPTALICWEANVITFGSSNVLGSTNFANITPPFQNGWLNLGIPTNIAGAAPNVHRLINAGATTVTGKGQTTTGNTVTYAGLPAIGFAVVSFTNGTLQVGTPPVNVLSNYGGNFVHKSSTTIQ